MYITMIIVVIFITLIIVVIVIVILFILIVIIIIIIIITLLYYYYRCCCCYCCCCWNQVSVLLSKLFRYFVAYRWRVEVVFYIRTRCSQWRENLRGQKCLHIQLGPFTEQGLYVLFSTQPAIFSHLKLRRLDANVLGYCCPWKPITHPVRPLKLVSFFSPYSCVLWLETTAWLELCMTISCWKRMTANLSIVGTWKQAQV